MFGTLRKVLPHICNYVSPEETTHIQPPATHAYATEQKNPPGFALCKYKYAPPVNSLNKMSSP